MALVLNLLALYVCRVERALTVALTAAFGAISPSVGRLAKNGNPPD
jgi:hypothetical protein